MVQPAEITLSVTPSSRFDMVDVAGDLAALYGDLSRTYRKITCCSLHTTAGYLEERLFAALGYSEKRVRQFVRFFQGVFPPNAGYFHDRMELRAELSAHEKEDEPPNADSHLTFIGAGIKNCVTYRARPKLAIYLIELDGIFKQRTRSRRTTILAYNRERTVYRGTFSIPAPADHPVNSFNLKDPQYRLFSHLDDLLKTHAIEKGLIDISLAPEERHAGLTVNEYETLLMRNDVPRALNDPLGYVVRRGRELLQNPGSIPARAKGYAVYDFVRLYNDLIDSTRIGRSIANKVLPYLSTPVSTVFRLTRSIDLLVSGGRLTRGGRIVQGTYQSPILLQYQAPPKGARRLEITLREFA